MVSDGPLWGRRMLGTSLVGDQPEFQMDPCGVEGPTGSPTTARPRAVSDGPLWGRRSRTNSRTSAARSRFRWTLVGSKGPAAVPRAGDSRVSDGPLWGRSFVEPANGNAQVTFQENPCGVEATCFAGSGRSTAGFRRTLVGSKQEPLAARGHVPQPFQENPCGVEAARLHRHVLNDRFQENPCGVEAGTRTLQRRSSLDRRRFQENPCGVEASPKRVLVTGWPCFRRTLMGSKRSPRVRIRRRRRGFQGNPCGVEASGRSRRAGPRCVSGEPSWGRSRGRQRDTTPTVFSFRRTLVGSKRLSVVRVSNEETVSGEPLWGRSVNLTIPNSGYSNVSGEPLWGRS